MKKSYETPEVKKVEFDYKENVTASNTQTKENTSCPSSPCYSGPSAKCWGWCTCK